MNLRFTGRVMIWMRFVRTSAVSLILPMTSESSESVPPSMLTELGPLGVAVASGGIGIPSGETRGARGAEPEEERCEGDGAAEARPLLQAGEEAARADQSEPAALRASPRADPDHRGVSA